MLMAFARSMTSTCRGPWPDEVATRSDPSFFTTVHTIRTFGAAARAASTHPLCLVKSQLRTRHFRLPTCTFLVTLALPAERMIVTIELADAARGTCL